MNVILRSVLCDEGSQPVHEGDPSLSLSWACRRAQDDYEFSEDGKTKIIVFT
jgi:hypothetical protein